jgi:YHS domain-containing protein
MRWIHACIAAFAALLLTACGSMHVISDGADSRLMLRGNDPVAYFTLGKTTPGSPNIKAEHQGVTYRFASEEHRTLFVANPDRFVPQFGGFCSNGIVYAVPGGASDSFKIIDGKLYMFGGVRSKLYFEMDEARNLKLAHHYWETEVKDSNWRIQSWKRIWFDKVEHYRTNAQLAAEYEKKYGKKPGA